MEWIKERIVKEAENEYKNFSAALIPNIDNVLGVRLPVLRKIAKEVYAADWQSFLAVNEFEYMEEAMLQGMVIGLIKDSPQKILEYVEAFVPKIDNWAVCDSFCCGLKFTKKNKQLVWNFLQSYLISNKEYEIRFGAVMLLDYFVDEDYIERVLEALDGISHEAYYVKMAVAWAVSICYIKFPQITGEYLKRSRLDDWTFNKSIQKIVESYRVDAATKDVLRKMKRK